MATRVGRTAWFAAAAGVFGLIVLSLPAPTAEAGSSDGAVSGWVAEVKVPAHIVNVCVSLRGPSSASTTTGSGGDYVIHGLAPGTYTAVANPACSGEDFLPATRKGIVVRAGETTRAVALDLKAKNNKLIGIVPPAVPSANCPASENAPVADINQCRGVEGVGPLVLPSNYSRLTPSEQMLVVFNLERVNRGLAPVIGLNAALDRDAEQGAATGTDPVGPGGYGWGSIWAGGYGSLELADWGWMYDDGYGSENEDCTTASSGGCWGHRNNILAPTNAIVGGGSLVTGHKAPYGWSAAFLFVFGYPTTHLVFRWSSELKYFKSPPRLERAGVPTVTSVVPGRGKAAGGTVVTIHGTRLWGVTGVDFGRRKATHIFCSGTVCTLRSPRSKPGTVTVSVTTLAGTSAIHRADRFTYT